MRLVVVDGHTLSRQGLARVIEAEPGLGLVGEAGSAAGGRLLCGTAGPDVAVIAARLPDLDGMAFAQELRRGHPDLGIVVMASAGNDDPMFRAMEAHASAYVADSADVPEILAAIKHAAVAPHSFTASGLAEALDRRDRGESLLSPRERETLALLMDGLSIAEIGRAMHLSHSTAKTYTARVYDKLGATNRTQALMTALRMGLVRQEAAEAGI